jgi:hypothetical protein
MQVFPKSTRRDFALNRIMADLARIVEVAADRGK